MVLLANALGLMPVEIANNNARQRIHWWAFCVKYIDAIAVLNVFMQAIKITYLFTIIHLSNGSYCLGVRWSFIHYDNSLVGGTEI